MLLSVNRVACLTCFQALAPASAMDPVKLSAATTDTTPSPYLAPPTVAAPAGGAKGGGGGKGDDRGGEAGGGQNWRWQIPGEGGAAAQRPTKRPRTNDKPPNPEATVFVRNIAFSADELALRQFFEARGPSYSFAPHHLCPHQHPCTMQMSLGSATAAADSRRSSERAMLRCPTRFVCGPAGMRVGRRRADSV